MDELYFGLFNEAVRENMLDENSPILFWDYCAERRDLITNVTEKDLFQLRGQTPPFATFFEEGDISNICQFGWYEWVYFCETTTELPFPPHALGRCLGLAKNKGNQMTKWMLKQNGQIVTRRKMQRLTPEELVRDSEVKNCAEFDADTKLRCGG